MANEIIKTSDQVSAIVPEIWSKRYYDVLLADLPFAPLISKDYEGEIQALGDTVNIPTIAEFDDAIELGEADAADADSTSASTQALVINRRVVKDFIVTRTSLLESLPFVEKLKEMAVYAINKKIQAIIISLTVPSASAPDHAIPYDSGTTASLADLLEAKELLDTQNVPMANRHIVMGAAQLNDIFNITGFTSSDFVASGSPLVSGQLPAQLLGFMPHFTTVVGNVMSLFHGSYMTMAAQEGMGVKEYDLGGDGIRATRVNTDTLIGVKQLDSKRVVQIS